MFCGNCGNQIPDDANVCPNCGTPVAGAAPQANSQPVVQPAPQADPYVQQAPYAQPMPQAPMSHNSNMATIALVCGIVSIVLAVLGGILFGVIPAVIAIALDVVAVVLGVNENKLSPEKKGNGALICGIIGLIFGVIFAAGCGICGCTSGGYGCYGCVGSSCKATSDVSRSMDSFGDLLEDMEDWN